MEAVEVLKNLIPLRWPAKSQPGPGPAERDWQRFESQMAELGQRQEPLIELVSRHVGVVDQVNALRRQVEDAAANVKSLRADALNHVVNGVVVAASEQELLSLRTRLASVEPEAEIAALAQSRAQSRLDELTRQVVELNTQRYRLAQNWILERLVARVLGPQPPIHAESRAEWVDAVVANLTEEASLAQAHDLLVTHVPGSYPAGLRYVLALELPVLDVRDFASQALPRDIWRAARPKAIALLADLGIRA
jgi:hypothetical protein